MKQEQNKAMYDRIERHSNHLNAIFNTEFEPVTLCKKLRTLEKKGELVATDYCNGAIESEVYEAKRDKIMSSVDKILGFRRLNIPVFLNGDPRGYALKIASEYTHDNKLDIERDMGGYGLIAPDLSN